MTNFHVGQKVFKPIPGYEGRYGVSSEGEIWSALSGKIVKGNLGSNGYLTVALHKQGSQKTFAIHRLVAQSFLPIDLSRRTINHKDGNRINNRSNNLEWCTPAENSAHGVKMGTITGVSLKLTCEQAETIRRSYKEGARMRDLAKIYAVSCSTVKNVIAGRFYPNNNGGS